MYFLLKYSLFRGHVSFPGCRLFTEEEGVHWKDEEKEDNEDEDDDVYNICLLDASHVCLIILHFTTYPNAVSFNGFRSRSTDITPYLTNSGSPTTTNREQQVHDIYYMNGWSFMGSM